MTETTALPAPQGLRGLRVLVVEDEYFIAQDMVEVLSAAGAVVVGPVATVADALDAVAREPLGAAVLDISLGEVFAFEVADALAAAGVPYLLSTGYDADFIPHRFAHVPRLGKPAEPGHVVVALVACLARAAGRVSG